MSELREYLADHDARCPKCGYNLRGLTEGKCPECGRWVWLKELREPRVRWGPWFWIAAGADFNVTLFAGLMMAGPERFPSASWMGVLMGTMLFFAMPTALFSMLALVRRVRMGEERFMQELTWSFWLALMFKGTCFAGMLVGGA